jgi:serine O-acetyltransferase
MADEPAWKDACKGAAAAEANYRRGLPEIAAAILGSCTERDCCTHIDYEPIPSRQAVLDILEHLRALLFPGYFSREKIDPVNLPYHVGQVTSIVFDALAEQIGRSIRHDCLRYNQACSDCDHRGRELAFEFLKTIPAIRRVLAADVAATYDGDPAAQSLDEIIFSYPGIYATAVYRVAHRLHRLGVPLLPRIMTECAHGATGIDIHPGAEIGGRFVIDHGTGVVIGETAVIGDNVRIYQGVTLGALSLPRDAGERLRGRKRHPTIEDDVIIYSGATILGGDTVIGARSVVGGNLWITESVPADTLVVMESPKLVYKPKPESPGRRQGGAVRRR